MLPMPTRVELQGNGELEEIRKDLVDLTSILSPMISRPTPRSGVEGLRKFSQDGGI